MIRPGTFGRWKTPHATAALEAQEDPSERGHPVCIQQQESNANPSDLSMTDSGKQLSSDSLPIPDPADWEAESAWINHRMRDFQEFWHDRFDEDATLRAAASERPDPLPVRADEDNRLIFDFIQADVETRRSCYAIFPEGQEMFERVEHYLASPRPDMPQSEARELIDELANHTEGRIPPESVEWANIAFMSYSTPGAGKLMRSIDGVPYLLEHIPQNGERGSDLRSRSANLFLTEMHYHAAGNFHELHQWVTGALLSPPVDKIYEILYRLWRAEWQVFCNEEGVLVVNRDA